jgi:hypothetical protein
MGEEVTELLRQVQADPTLQFTEVPTERRRCL